MTDTARRNLAVPHSIEIRTRVKTVKALKDALARFATLCADRADAIHAINSRRPMARARATGYEGSGVVMLQAASNLQRDGLEDAAWVKALKDVEQARAALERKVLVLEAIAAREYGAAWADATEGEEEEE